MPSPRPPISPWLSRRERVKREIEAQNLAIVLPRLEPVDDVPFPVLQRDPFRCLHPALQAHLVTDPHDHELPVARLPPTGWLDDDHLAVEDAERAQAVA